MLAAGWRGWRPGLAPGFAGAFEIEASLKKLQLTVPAPLTVTALRLGGGGLLAFGESGDSLRLWGVGPQHFLLRDRGLLIFFWMSNCL